jgi:hypothetical protein
MFCVDEKNMSVGVILNMAAKPRARIQDYFMDELINEFQFYKDVFNGSYWCRHFGCCISCLLEFRQQALKYKMLLNFWISGLGSFIFLNADYVYVRTVLFP